MIISLTTNYYFHNVVCIENVILIITLNNNMYENFKWILYRRNSTFQPVITFTNHAWNYYSMNEYQTHKCVWIETTKLCKAFYRIQMILLIKCLSYLIWNFSVSFEGGRCVIIANLLCIYILNFCLKFNVYHFGYL